MTLTRSVNRATLRARRHERWRALIISCVGLAVMASGAAAVIAIGTLQPPPEMGGASSTSEAKHRNANVVDELSHQCQSFDNHTGRMTLAGPCRAPVLDSNGVPVPSGTVHRLDTISKSFSGH
jgi:hypothetical protein